MRAIQIQGKFGLESLTLTERTLPPPGPHEVRIRTRAASLNYRDLLMTRGHYNPKQPLPLVPLSDGVGEVTAIGANVRRVKVGDRVSSSFTLAWISGEPMRAKLGAALGGPVDGWLAEEVQYPEEALVHVPKFLTDQEAATLPCAGVTAWSALMQGQVKAGDTVLVQGTGGVSLFALQLAKLLGARVIATSSSDEKLARARTLGATETINYKAEPQWGKKARELSGGEGVDLVIEVGGAGTLEQSIRAVRPGGQISLIGILSGGAGPVDLRPVLMQNIRIQGVLVGSRERYEELLKAVALHQLHPVIDRTFPWTEARAALEHLASGAHFGKIGLSF